MTWNFEPSRLQGETAAFDIKDADGKLIVAKDKRITARHVRLMNEAGVKSLSVPDEFLIGRVLAKAVYDKTTGERSLMPTTKSPRIRSKLCENTRSVRSIRSLRTILTVVPTSPTRCVWMKIPTSSPLASPFTA